MKKNQPTAAQGGRPQPHQDARHRLLALPDSDPYYAVANGTYRHNIVTDLAAWNTAQPLLVQLLADEADADLPLTSSRRHKRALLGEYTYHLATVDPDRLTVEDALVEHRVVRWLESDDEDRRSHHSRMAAKAFVLGLREMYPHLATPRLTITGRPLARKAVPYTESQFDLLWRLAETATDLDTRRRLLSMLCLGRGAGIDGGALQWVTGNHVVTRPGAGVWVVVPPEAKKPGEVPVLERFAAPLLALAEQAGDLVMVGLCEAPASRTRISGLDEHMNRRLNRGNHDFRLTPEALRRTWVADHLDRNTPIRALLQCSRLITMRRIIEAVLDYTEPVSDPVLLAQHMGAVKAVRS